MARVTIAGLEAEIRRLKTELKTQRKELREANTVLGEEKEENEHLHTVIKSQGENADERRREIQDLVEANAQLRDEAEGLKSKLGEANENLTKFRAIIADLTRFAINHGAGIGTAQDGCPIVEINHDNDEEE